VAVLFDRLGEREAERLEDVVGRVGLGQRVGDQARDARVLQCLGEQRAGGGGR